MGILVLKPVMAFLIALLVIFLVLSWISERLLIGLHYEPKVEDPTLTHTLHWVLRELDAGLPSPKIFVLRDSAPNLFAARGIFSSGVVMISQVLVSALTEEEMADILRLAVRRVSSRSIYVTTVLSTLLSLLVIAIGDAWARFWFSLHRFEEPEPWRPMGLSVSRFFLFLSSVPFLDWFYVRLRSRAWRVSLSDHPATRKIRVWNQYRGIRPVLGAFALYLNPSTPQ